MKTIKTAEQAQKTKAQTKSGNVKSFKKMDILDHLEKIFQNCQEVGNGMDEYLSKEKQSINYVTKKLSISPMQALLFANFLAKSDDNSIQISDIASTIGCSQIRILKCMNDIDILEKKKLIRCSRNGRHITYRVPYEVSNSLRKSNKFISQENSKLSNEKFFTILEQLLDERRDDELTFDDMADELQNLIDLNMHLEFCRVIKGYKLDNDDLVLLLCFCHLYYNNNDDNIGIYDLNFLHENKVKIKEIKKSLSIGSHYLIEKKLVEYNNDNGLIDNESWKLSDRAKKELLSDMCLNIKLNYKKNLILFDDIKPKKMFYNSRETKEIETLSSLLSEENYMKIQERLDGRGMRKGFACLFSGGPGTGKTETAYQIARETKRNIMMVDLSQIKSCWVGESEKKIKEVFNTYRHAVDNSEIAPILLFNEADGIIGKRKEFNSTSRAVDQMENTIQNIILQEMETLSGIMIATTNLTQNMDSAFERRFLYKIIFDRPSIESRNGIWNALIPDLPKEQAEELSCKFDLSGGQIENIARKIEVDAIIQGENLAMDTLLQYCKDEVNNSFNEKTKKIGFV